MAAGDQAVDQAGSHVAAADKTDFCCFHAVSVLSECLRILPNIGADYKFTNGFFKSNVLK